MKYLAEDNFSLRVEGLRIEYLLDIYPFGEVKHGYTLPKLPMTLMLRIETQDKTNVGSVRATMVGEGHFRADITDLNLPSSCYPLIFRCRRQGP